MEIVCSHCQSKFRLADEKLPSGRSVAVKCPKCDNSIDINGQAQPSPREPASEPNAAAKDVGPVSYEPSDRPFDYLQEGIETALLCEHDLEAKHKIQTVLDKMDYHVVEAASARNALKYMRFHNYDLVVVNESFESSNTDNNHVLQYLVQLPISIRREIFVVLLSKSFRTMDNMMAFNKSVNLIVNLSDLNDIEKIMKGALKEHKAFYKAFRDALVKIGRA